MAARTVAFFQPKLLFMLLSTGDSPAGDRTYLWNGFRHELCSSYFEGACVGRPPVRAGSSQVDENCEPTVAGVSAFVGDEERDCAERFL